ncbi:MAG: response regulator [Proteobacteria bacterium]|nr:response regulator [Pseudomonadota bacterium]
MAEMKYDVRRGADTYRLIYHSRLKSWILRDIIKRDEALVWRSGLSGWRPPEDLPELRPYFEQREEEYLRRELAEEKPLLFPKKRIKDILIIDDEEDLCWLLSNSLTGKGYNVSTANTIRDGIDCLDKTPDLIFLDLKLPDGDGMDLLPKIKRIIADPLVVIISAYGSEERRQDAKKKGVHSFIDKPLSEEKILSTIGQFQEKSVNSEEI